MSNFVTTRDGHLFYFDQLNVESIPLHSVAHSLSQQCRFNGHIEEHYSVAEHSVHISHLVLEYGGSPDTALYGLLHDASEAFMGDMPRPLKKMFPAFSNLESRIMEKYCELYSIDDPDVKMVQWLDCNIVRDEAEKFYAEPPEWTKEYASVIHPDRLLGWDAMAVKYIFLEQFQHLQEARNYGKDALRYERGSLLGRFRTATQ